MLASLIFSESEFQGSNGLRSGIGELPQGEKGFAEFA
jgi:hypothetical protein